MASPLSTLSPARALGLHLGGSRSRWPACCLALALVFALTSAAGPAHAQSPREDYRIARHDLLHFQIFEEPDTEIVQRVSATGELPLPMIGIVNVAGMTLRSAEEKIRQMYIEQDYFVAPQVILVVEQYNERSVSVLGQVNKPSQIPLPLEADSMNIVEAITYAGGLTRLARADAVQVTRVEAGQREQRFNVNIEAYLAGGRAQNSASGFQLQPGDIVFIPERTF